MRRYDAVVVGAGAGGGSAALALAKAGLSVAVVERSAFPRRKVCGEFVSAATFPILDAMGVGEAARAAGGPPVSRVGVFGREAIVTAPMPVPADGGAAHGRTLRRDALDPLLLQAAREAGAEVFQPWKGVGLRSVEGGHVLTIAGEGRTEELEARLLVAAHGSWEPGALPTQPAKSSRASDLLAFKAYWRGATFDPDLIVLAGFPGGYAGMVHRDAGTVGLSACVRRDALARYRERFPAATAGESVFAAISHSVRGVREALAGAEYEGAPMAAGPLRPGIRPGYVPGALGGGIFRVGNAAGEAHPAIAEGISIAIQSGVLLGRHLAGLGDLGDRRGLDAAGAAYAAAWRAQFGGRLRAARIYARACMSPAAGTALAPVLAAFPGLLTFGAAMSGKTKPLRAGFQS